MMRVIGAAAVAATLAVAGSASAATTVLQTGTLTQTGAVGGFFNMPNGSAPSWELKFVSSGNVTPADVTAYLHTRRLFQYDYDNPLFSYGGEKVSDLQVIQTPAADGFTMRFTIPGPTEQLGPHQGYTYWEDLTVNPFASVTLNVADTPVTYSFSISPAPEPATWAMMIVGFGATGSAIRARRRQFAIPA